MQKFYAIVFLASFLFPIGLKADWISVNNKTVSPAAPNITLVSDDNNSTVIKIEIQGFELSDLQVYGKEYQLADLLSESFINKPGSPALAYIAKTLAIPDHASVSVEIIETGAVLTYQNINISPARESWLEGDPETAYNENLSIYQKDEVFPTQQVSVDPPSIFRDLRIIRMSVYPFRYNPAKKELQLTTSLTIKINYGSGQVINPKTTPKREISPSFGQLYRSFIFNYQNVLDNKYGGKESGHELMLCVMPDDFYNSFQAYAQWKRESGIDIHITKFSDIGANSSDPDIIRNHLADAYTNWDVPPTYALLVGDAQIIPYYTSSGYVDENHYVEIDGNDYFPDIILGRFTNQSDYTMQVMVNKFQLYEKQPYIADTDWFKKGICCSNNAYQSQVETKRFAAERMIVDGGFSVDTMMSDPGCTYSNADVVNAINEGRSHLNYRGEGWTTGWWASCTPMTNTEVSSLTNGQKFTFVTSIGCGVAMFAAGSESFGETWIEQGTLSNPKGAAAFIGPAGNTHTTYNNKIDKGIYTGMFVEKLNTAGQGLVRGKLYLYNVYGTDPYVEYHYKIYCVLGDPSIHIWKDVPKAVTVDYPASITFGTSLVEFTVNHTSTGAPVSDAIVCVSGTGVFVTGTTDASGKAYLEITSEDLQTLTITVTGPTVYPFQGILDVIPPTGPWVIKDYFLLDDNAGGNGNGLMDYDESILLSLAMKNVGPLNASNILVEISTNDPFITITDNSHTYPAILSGQSVLENNGFAFTVADNIPDGHEVLFSVTASTAFQSWDSYFFIIANAPVLSMGNIMILDPGGNNNGLLDPGENATIIFPVTNVGTSMSSEATAYLSSTYPFITLNNATDNLGAIDVAESVDASFNVSVDPDALMGDLVDFEAQVIAGSYDTLKSYGASIGYMIEDWETGTFDKFPWTMSGSADWILVTDSPFEGVYCARSGNIGDSQTSNLEININVTGDGELSFYRKVSSENNYDYLRFYIDGSLMEDWAGSVPWGQVSYPVTAGNHSFEWQYYKDYSVSTGEDCAWIDFIVFPSPEPPVTPPYQTNFDEGGNIPDGWFNVADDDLDWTLYTGSTPSPHTGPTGDHTTGSGYYFYTEATYNNPDFRADLITPTFNLTTLTNTELSFWYHMWDDDYMHMGTLHLDVFFDEVWVEDIMPPISGNQGNQWFERIVDLGAYEGEIVKFRFRGITGADWASDICIDDFAIDGIEMPSSLTVDLTAFLQGPFVDSEMTTSLCACSFMPLTQPFYNPPWIYNGTEYVTTMPGNAVDWVLVELRDASSPAEATSATIAGRQAALLLNDGSIVATDGTSPLIFDITISNSLFAVIYQRNHLAVMSANAVSPSNDIYTYNFSTSADQAYGSNALTQLSGSIWGMISGDCDADGVIGMDDLVPDWSANAGKTGFFPTDLNLDGQVNNMDKDDCWTPNTGQVSNVPD
ncbi:MAG: choice-of-anchor J domain-containing protein [Bacteroidales bacterium]|nr:choice-of-anchor J domain-containing protein [Bacteroidales bacterium]MCF8403411.1 choice-of-anchor J domain-containing protein [Bacteroidales bacterium]